MGVCARRQGQFVVWQLEVVQRLRWSVTQKGSIGWSVFRARARVRAMCVLCAVLWLHICEQAAAVLGLFENACQVCQDLKAWLV